MAPSITVMEILWSAYSTLLEMPVASSAIVASARLSITWTRRWRATGDNRGNLDLIQVRIGTSRRSPVPNYRIERGWLIDDESTAARVYRICDGRTHKETMEWTDAVVNERWSETAISMAQLEILLSKVPHAS